VTQGAGNSARSRPFTATTFLIAGGLLSWLAVFMFVYIFAALACARGFADARLAGLPIVPLIGSAAIGLTALVTVVLMRRAHRSAAQDSHARFIAFVAVAASAIALVALVWLMLPALMVRACNGG